MFRSPFASLRVRLASIGLDLITDTERHISREGEAKGGKVVSGGIWHNLSIRAYPVPVPHGAKLRGLFDD